MEMKQGIRALRLQYSGGLDGLSATLLNQLAKALPNLVLRAIQEITLLQNKL